MKLEKKITKMTTFANVMFLSRVPRSDHQHQTNMWTVSGYRIQFFQEKI